MPRPAPLTLNQRYSARLDGKATVDLTVVDFDRNDIYARVDGDPFLRALPRDTHLQPHKRQKVAPPTTDRVVRPVDYHADTDRACLPVHFKDLNQLMHAASPPNVLPNAIDSVPFTDPPTESFELDGGIFVKVDDCLAVFADRLAHHLVCHPHYTVLEYLPGPPHIHSLLHQCVLDARAMEKKLCKEVDRIRRTQGPRAAAYHRRQTLLPKPRAPFHAVNFFDAPPSVFREFVRAYSRGHAVPGMPPHLAERYATQLRDRTCLNFYLLKVQGVRFSRPGTFGDFEHMRHEEGALFIYNDNLEQFLDKKDRRAGGGNACMRPYRYDNAMPVPTGTKGRGFDSLHEKIDGRTVRDVIRAAVDDIVHFLRDRPHVRTVYYSADPHTDDLLGQSIFAVAPAVRAHIVDELRKLAFYIMAK